MTPQVSSAYGYQAQPVYETRRARRARGTYCHGEIAFEFGSWRRPELKLHLIKGRRRRTNWGWVLGCSSKGGCTYLGGSGTDNGYGVTVDGVGNVLVTGETYSSGWISGGFDTSFNGLDDAFVAKLSPSGARLWSTYVGGSDYDKGNGIAMDGAGTGCLSWARGRGSEPGLR